MGILHGRKLKMKETKMFTRILTASALIVGLSQIPALTQAGTVFIPEGSNDTILMVQSETGEVLRRLSGVEAVHGLAGAAGAKYLVAGSYAEIDREDADSLAVPTGVSEDEHAAHHAKPVKNVGPTDAGISILSIIDAETGDIIRRIEVPGAVHHTAMSPDGRYAVATHPTSDGISVIDLETLTFAAFIPTGYSPNYAVFGDDPAIVYVTNTGNGTISEVNIEQGFVARNIPVGEAPEHLIIDADNERLYVADADAGVVYELLYITGEISRSFPIGGEIHAVGLSGDSGTLFVSGKGEDKLVAIDLDSGKFSSIPLGPDPYHLTVVPGIDAIYVSSRSEPKIWVIDQQTLAIRSEFGIQGEGHQMVALP